MGTFNRLARSVKAFSRELGRTELKPAAAPVPRFGLALAKKAINQAEDRMGLRDVMDATFALHHLAHAHNSLTSEDHLAGQDAKSMAKSLK